ncbi:MAG: hypothetical protein JXR34_06870 [Bacteroidales bacterium]|nr:hypothetical protein [Bacteroidales bacterium]
MAGLSGLRRLLLNKELSKKVVRMERQRAFFNLESAKSIGVVFDATNESDYNKVASFVRHIQTFHKTVKVIGYVNYKDLPHFIHQRLAYDFVLSKDLAFNGRPQNTFAKDFIKTEFDLLIDFNLSLISPLKYITALSMAKCKVGLMSDEMKTYYDLMIQGVESNDLPRFIKEVLSLLEDLQPKK